MSSVIKVASYQEGALFPSHWGRSSGVPKCFPAGKTPEMTVDTSLMTYSASLC